MSKELNMLRSKGPSPIFSRNPTGFPKENSPNAHEGEECHLVLRGKLEVQHGEDIAIVEEGDSFSWNACVPHIVRNIGEETALLLISSYAENRKRVY